MTKLLHPSLLLLMLLPLTAQGQASIVVEPTDNPLVIRGWIGDENSFIGNIGVTLQAAPGSAAVKLNIYKTDLKMEGGETIGRQSVTVTGDATLTPEETSTYQVKVTGVKEPGEYHGQIDLALAGQQRSTAKHVDVTLVASVRPSLSLLAENDRLSANLVHCHYCRLAYWLVPAAHQNKIDLWFEKPLAAPLTINDTTIAVKGDQSRFKITPNELQISPDQLRQVQQPGGTNEQGKKYLTLPVTIVSGGIPADHYSGSIYIAVAGQSSALKVPVDFNVRSGPVWPLLALLVSILLGRLFKFMQDKGNALADALESINRLEFRLRNAHPDDQQIITPMLQTARDLVHQNKAAEAATAVTAISARLSALNELRQLEARLEGKDPNAVAAIRTNISEARERIRFQQDEQAKTLITQIKDALVALVRTPSLTDSNRSDFADAVDRADAASVAVAGLGTVIRSRWHRLRDWLVTISGVSEEFRAEASLFLARPLLWAALLLGVLALGLKTLYVDNPTFGANPFTDFLGLMFWGLSADIASRTLSNLQLTSGNRPGGG
jgi:hypothetical protein